MSLSPYPSGSSRCGAAKTVVVIPWIEGVRCPSARTTRTVFCDRPNYHVWKLAEHERRHYDQSTGIAWVDAVEFEEDMS